MDVDETALALDNSWQEYDNYKDYSEEEFRKDVIEQKVKSLPGAAKLTNLVHITRWVCKFCN